MGEYDATTGATINATFINSSQGLNNPEDLAFVAVPEPSSLLLVAGAAVSAAGMWRRRMSESVQLPKTASAFCAALNELGLIAFSQLAGAAGRLCVSADRGASSPVVVR